MLNQDFRKLKKLGTVVVFVSITCFKISDPHSLPPCIRLIVMDSDHLDYGSLFIITCDGGTVGREKQYGNIIIIPDINISKVWVIQWYLMMRIVYNYNSQLYDV